MKSVTCLMVDPRPSVAQRGPNPPSVSQFCKPTSPGAIRQSRLSRLRLVETSHRDGKQLREENESRITMHSTGNLHILLPFAKQPITLDSIFSSFTDEVSDSQVQDVRNTSYQAKKINKVWWGFSQDSSGGGCRASGCFVGNFMLCFNNIEWECVT